MSERTAGALRVTVGDPVGDERETAVLRVADEAGTVGWGEASPLPGYSPDALDDVERALDAWAVRWTRGEPPPASPDPALEGLPAARCAIDTALLDLAARGLGVPLHAVLLDLVDPARGVQRLAVAGLVTLEGADRPGAPAEARSPIAAVAALVAEGHRVVKVKLGGAAGFARELEQLREIRAEFPYLTLRLDVNGRWNEEVVRERLVELKREINPEFVEQPVGAEALLSLGAMPAPIAADESLRLPNAIERLTGPSGCAVLVLKPTILGGLRPCLELAKRAFADGMRVVVSHTFGGRIAHASACELALALAAADPAGGSPAAGLAGHDDLAQRSGPWIVPSGEPGHGVDPPW